MTIRFYSLGAGTISSLEVWLQYIIYAAIIVLGVLALSLIKRKQRPISHAELCKRLTALYSGINDYKTKLSDKTLRHFDAYRSLQKLIYAADKLIYLSSVLAEKERDTAITNISITVEAVRAQLLSVKNTWKSENSDEKIDMSKLLKAMRMLDPAIDTCNRILERDKLFNSK